MAYTVYSHETLKEYFKENPVTIWYVLRYPVEIPRIHAKGHVITHHGSTTIDVQPQTMGKVTPVVKATIEDSSIEMDSVPTLTINNTEEGNQITDLTFEGVTIVNNAKGDNVKGTKEVSHTRYDFAPFYDGQTVINNTIEGGYVSAKLYGDTMINIAKPYGETDLLTATEDGAIVDLLGENTDGVKLTDGTLTEGRLYGDSLVNLCNDYLDGWLLSQNGGIVIKNMKPSTQYTIMLDYIVKNSSSEIIIQGYNDTKYVRNITGIKDLPDKVVIHITLNDSENSIRILNPSNADKQIAFSNVMVVEGSYETLNYFEGIGSTINPDITIISHPFIFGKGGRL